MKKNVLLLILLLISFNYSYSQKKDSLFTKRVFISTYIYKNGENLTNDKINELYKETWQPKIKYKWSKILKPIGPVVAIGGIGLAYIALKGVDATAIIDGKQVNYKIRSLPKLLTGMGLFVGGLSMVESSNELVQHSVDIYNSMLVPAKKVGYVDKIKFGITENNAVGFSIILK